MQDEKSHSKHLEEKVQKLLRDLSVLKNALLKEQALRKESEEKIRDKEIEIRQKTEQIESLEFNNSRLIKRIESLKEEINKKSEGKPSFLNNLLHGSQKEELEKLQRSLTIVSEDLHVKIAENEKLNVRMYEFKEEQRVKVENLESKLQENIKINKEQSQLLGELKSRKEYLTIVLDEVESQKRTLERELSEKIRLLSSQEIIYKHEKETLTIRIKDLEELIARRIPFNEYKNPSLNSLNKTELKKSSAAENELLQKVITSSELSIQNVDELIEAFVNKLVFVSTYAGTEDQKTYNLYSAKIRESLPEYKSKWIESLKGLLELVILLSNLDQKGFSKNINLLVNRGSMIEEKSNKLIEHFPCLLTTFESLEGQLKNLFDEEITLVNHIVFLREKNEMILKEFREFINCMTKIFQTVKDLMLPNPTINCVESDRKATYWLVLSGDLKIFSKSLERLVQTYQDKLNKEEEGFEEIIDDNEDESGKIIYTFRDETLVPKFKKINNNLSSTLQAFFKHTSLSITCFVEYLENQFGNVVRNKGATYPVNFIGQAYLGKIAFTHGINSLLRSQPKGIPYQEALDNKKELKAFKEKENFYNEQISSLKNALKQAESQIDDIKDDQSVFSDTSTVKIYEKNNETLLSLSKASRIISFLKDKYEEVCKKINEKATYIHKDFTLEEIESFIKDNISEKKEPEKKIIKTNMEGKHDLFDNHDTENFNENVAKGLQRISMNYMNKQLKLVPLNKLTQNDENASEKTKILLEKAKEKILELALKNERLEQEREDFNLKYEATKDSFETEKRLREHIEKNYKELERNVFKLKGELESVKTNYDAQIKMLSEHIISLTSKG